MLGDSAPALELGRCNLAGLDAQLRRLKWIRELSPDGWVLFATGGLRNLAYGFLSVVLALYLAALGLDIIAVGFIFTAALAGGAVMTAAFTAVADQVGRRRVLLVGTGLMAVAGAVFALTDNPLLLLAAAVVGTISPSGREVGPFLSIEQAILPQTTTDRNRTGLFAAYNLVAYLAGALGTLVVGVPSLLGMEPLEGYRALLWSYVAVSILLMLLFARLSPQAEAQAVASTSSGPRSRLGLHRSRPVVAKLAALFAIDAFGGGFVVQGLVAYWFHLRFGLDTPALGAIFFGTNLLTALSLLAAAPIARRFGLLNTMVFSHLPSHVLLMLVPFMPSVELAVGMLLARHLLSQLDVPTRQSYMMAIVDPDERSAAAGFTSVARNAAAAVAPVFSGATLAVPGLGLPFLIGGGMKIVYDVALFMLFRGVRPPEERD